LEECTRICSADADNFESVLVLPGAKCFSALLIEKLYDLVEQYESCMDAFSSSFKLPKQDFEITIITRPTQFGVQQYADKAFFGFTYTRAEMENMLEVVMAAQACNLEAFYLVHAQTESPENGDVEFVYPRVLVASDDDFFCWNDDSKRMELTELASDLVLGDSAESDKQYSIETARSITVRCSMFLKATHVTVDDFTRTDSAGYGLIESMLGFENFKELRGVFVRELMGTGLVLVNIFTWPSCKKLIEEKIVKFASLKEFSRTINGQKVQAWVDVHQDEALKRCGYDPAEKVKCTPEEAAKAAEKAATAATASVRAAMESSNLQFAERLTSLAETTVGVEAANASMAERNAMNHAQQQAAAAAHEAKIQEMEMEHQKLKATQLEAQTELTAERARATAAEAALKTALANQVDTSQLLEQRLGTALLQLADSQNKQHQAQTDLLNGIRQLGTRVDSVEGRALEFSATDSERTHSDVFHSIADA